MDIQHVEFDQATQIWKIDSIEAIRAWASGRDLPLSLHVEIGSNRGRFLKLAAALRPDRTLLGIEIRSRYADALALELAQDGPPNAAVLAADANLALPLLFANGTVERLYVLFPDPWWKKRHSKRRLLTPAFFDLVADKIQPDGLFVIKTDVEPYAEAVAEMAAASARWRRIHPGDPRWPQDEDRWPQTTREVKITRQGLPVWKILLTPTGHDARDQDTIPTPQRLKDRFEKPTSTEDPTQRPRARRQPAPPGKKGR